MSNSEAQYIAALEQQVVNLSSQLAAAQGQPGQLRLLTGVKVQPPLLFAGATDGDSVTNFILQLNNYFALIQLTNDNLRVRYTETFLVERAKTWYATQQYDLMIITWTDMIDDFKAAFRPADFTRQARVQLTKIRMTTPDVANYIARFNIAYIRCIDLVPEEGQFIFEQNLWAEVQAQVLA